MESGETTRQKKVSRLIQKDIADYFLQKGREYAPGKIISVTRVRISPDLSFAKIYISIFPANDIEAVLETIQNHISTIRYRLGHKVRNQLRIIPEITFLLDDSLDYIDNIEKLLKK